jgi:hypothetical protein
MFDKPLAILLGRACQYAYDLPQALPNVFTATSFGACAAPFNCSDNGGQNTSFASVLSFETMRVVAFQGTITRDMKHLGENDFQAVRDWLANFQVEFTTAESLRFQVPGRLHKGFAAQLNVIYPALLAELKRGRQTPIYVTGHSQGGAVAAIATKAFATDGLPVAATYTFAAPRPGDSRFAESVTTEVHRLEFGDDIVPHVPMRTALPAFFERTARAAIPDGPAKDLLLNLARKANASYHPVGALTYVSGDGGIRLFDTSEVEESDLTNQRRVHLLVAGKNLAEHHHMYNYLHGILDVSFEEAKLLA